MPLFKSLAVVETVLQMFPQPHLGLTFDYDEVEEAFRSSYEKESSVKLLVCCLLFFMLQVIVEVPLYVHSVTEAATPFTWQAADVRTAHFLIQIFVSLVLLMVASAQTLASRRRLQRINWELTWVIVLSLALLASTFGSGWILPGLSGPSFRSEQQPQSSLGEPRTGLLSTVLVLPCSQFSPVRCCIAWAPPLVATVSLAVATSLSKGGSTAADVLFLAVICVSSFLANRHREQFARAEFLASSWTRTNARTGTRPVPQKSTESLPLVPSQTAGGARATTSGLLTLKGLRMRSSDKVAPVPATFEQDDALMMTVIRLNENLVVEDSGPAETRAFGREVEGVSFLDLVAEVDRNFIRRCLESQSTPEEALEVLLERGAGTQPAQLRLLNTGLPHPSMLVVINLKPLGNQTRVGTSSHGCQGKTISAGLLPVPEDEGESTPLSPDREESRNGNGTLALPKSALNRRVSNGERGSGQVAFNESQLSQVVFGEPSPGINELRNSSQDLDGMSPTAATAQASPPMNHMSSLTSMAMAHLDSEQQGARPMIVAPSFQHISSMASVAVGPVESDMSSVPSSAAAMAARTLGPMPRSGTSHSSASSKSDHSSSSLFSFSYSDSDAGSSLSGRTRRRLEISEAEVQTTLVKVEEMGSQTAISWEKDGFKCKNCAKPPLMPGDHQLVPTWQKQIERQRSRSRSSSRGRSREQQQQAGDANSQDPRVGCGHISHVLNGTWHITGNTEKACNWITRFTIIDDLVFDATGKKHALKLTHDRHLMFSGGTLHLDSEGVLSRKGKSGYTFFFVRKSQEKPGSSLWDEGNLQPNANTSSGPLVEAGELPSVIVGSAESIGDGDDDAASLGMDELDMALIAMEADALEGYMRS